MRFPGSSDPEFDWPWARSMYRYAPSEEPGYRRALARVLGAVYALKR